MARALAGPLGIAVEISPGHMFRQLSEVDPRKKKSGGGFLEGWIQLPMVEQSSEALMKVVVSSYPAASQFTDEQLQEHPQLASFSPCVLQHVRKPKGRLEYEKMPVPYLDHYNQEFLVNTGDHTVFIRKNVSHLDDGRINVEKLGDWEQVAKIDGDMRMHLGKADDHLKLRVIFPNSDTRCKTEDDGITTKKMLQHRNLPLHLSTLITNHDQIRIHVEVQLPGVDVEWETIGEGLSQTVTNTKSKHLGTLEIYDRAPHSSCSFGGSKVMIVSEFSLAKDVKPQFQLWDPRTGERVAEEEEERLLNNQIDMEEEQEKRQRRIDAEETFPTKWPERHRQSEQTNTNIKSKIVAGRVLIFKTPCQPHIEEINLRSFEFKLVVKRMSDGAESNAFNFCYYTHDSWKVEVVQDQFLARETKQQFCMMACLYCHLAQQEDIQTIGVAKPGENKRKWKIQANTRRPAKALRADPWYDLDAQGPYPVEAQGLMSPDSGRGGSPTLGSPADLTLPELLGSMDYSNIQADSNKPKARRGEASATVQQIQGGREAQWVKGEAVSLWHALADVMASEDVPLATRFLLVIMILLLDLAGEKTSERDRNKLFYKLMNVGVLFPVFLGGFLVAITSLGLMPDFSIGSLDFYLLLVFLSLSLTILFRRKFQT